MIVADTRIARASSRGVFALLIDCSLRPQSKPECFSGGMTMTIGSRRAHFALGVIIVTIAALALDTVSAMAAQYAHERLWSDLLARPSGPGAFRFLLQPTTAAIVALRDGIADARASRSPYLGGMLKVPAEGRARLRDGMHQTRRILLLGIAMDSIYQLAVLKTLYPLELILIVLLLCFVPYLLLRGPFARIARWWLLHRTAG